eukprot:gene2818-5660_t
MFASAYSNNTLPILDCFFSEWTGSISHTEKVTILQTLWPVLLIHTPALLLHTSLLTQIASALHSHRAATLINFSGALPTSTPSTCTQRTLPPPPPPTTVGEEEVEAVVVT